MADAASMIDRCFRHQHPEAYGGEVPAEGVVPPGLRYGAGELPASVVTIREEYMGNGEVLT